MARTIRLIICLVLWAGSAAAELQSLFPLGSHRAPSALDGVPERRGGTLAAAAVPSLFSGAENNRSFFAPLPERAMPGRAVPPLAGTTPAARLLSLIAEAEAGRMGYDAVQYGARIRPAKLPTRMTLGEIYTWIEATPGQPHAIGRYQFIPATLRRVARLKGYGPEVRFSPGVQDQLAMVLLEDAGLSRFRAGTIPRRTFMRNLAKIWAGLPLPNGKSYYEGYAGNKASMSWVRFEAGMARIWPAGVGG